MSPTIRIDTPLGFSCDGIAVVVGSGSAGSVHTAVGSPNDPPGQPDEGRDDPKDAQPPEPVLSVDGESDDASNRRA